MVQPTRIDAIGTTLAIVWSDGQESYYEMEALRAASPSAETTGERDLLGNQIGGDARKKYPGVTVTGWEIVGGYAVQFRFSDGHSTGLYAYDYLRKLAELEGS